MSIDHDRRHDQHELGAAIAAVLEAPSCSPAMQALRRVTRRALLTIYSPQQAAIWLTVHGSGDPVGVARKAYRLCGFDPSPTDVETVPGSGHDEPCQPVEGPRVEGLAMVPELTGDPMATRRPRPVRTGSHRGEESAAGPSELEVREMIISALRDIYTAEQPEEVHALLLEAVARLGGVLSRADEADAYSLPIDLSLGVGAPLLAAPDARVTGAAHRLRTHVPRLVEDARHAVDRLHRSGRLASDAEHDALTGLLNRRAYQRLAGRLRPGDALVLLDFDDFKAVNDIHGHIAGDHVLQAFGAVLREQIRITEHAVRLGGDEFLIVLEAPGDDGPERLLERLREAWDAHRPLPVRFSAGVAVVSRGVDAALEAADRALYDRKHARSAIAAARYSR